MKRIICLFGALALGTAGTLAADGQVEITVDYQRQAGRGSNQFAVYIENPAGEILRTLYVTRFTAQGGYANRPSCTPVWVEKSGVAEMDRNRIDVFSGATPQSGQLRYIWDMKDDRGNVVPAGAYYFVVEGTYLGDNRVIFRACVDTSGGAVTVNAEPEFNSGEDQNRGMLSGVSARFVP